jgi:methylphosphotriester-DNA--protein-cysteine methyltransferase
MFRGGLAPAAFRRIEAITATAIDEATSPSLSQLADAAVSLLRFAEVSVAEVAYKVGFSTPAHFVSTLRTALGVTPGVLHEALAG